MNALKCRFVPVLASANLQLDSLSVSLSEAGSHTEQLQILCRHNLQFGCFGHEPSFIGRKACITPMIIQLWYKSLWTNLGCL